MTETQISATISASTKEQVERYAEAHGVKKGHLVEQALLHHLQALHELPANIVIPPRLTVTRRSFEQVTGLVTKPRKPTKALRDLMAGEPASAEAVRDGAALEGTPEPPGSRGAVTPR